MQKTKLLNRVV